jgi:transcriptional regulator with XRE-family HTH domain
MDELKLVVASNLIKLRQQAGMTQAELGEKLNYSDKTVSKWERGESIPDAYVLTQLANLYGLTVDALLHTDDGWHAPEDGPHAAQDGDTPTFRSNVVTMVAIAGIWTAAIILFVVLWLALDKLVWIVYPSAMPVTLITLLVLNSVWNQGRHNMIIVMALVASIIVLIYLVLLSLHPWQIFLILLPAELIVVLSFHICHHDR